MSNPQDSAAAAYIINSPARGIGEKTAEALFNWVEASRGEAARMTEDNMNAVTSGTILDHLFSLLRDSAQSQEPSVEDSIPETINHISSCPLNSRQVKSLLSFASVMWALQQELGNAKSLSGLMISLLEVTNLQSHFEKISGSAEESEDRMRNVRELRLSAAARFPGVRGSIAADLAEFLQEVSLLVEDESVAQTSAGEEDVAARVSLMTIHASKGMEFNTVFLTGVENGVLPLSRRPREGDEEVSGNYDVDAEELRLAFVAVTRAKKRLYISYRRKSLVFVKAGARHVKCTPSTFIDRLRGLPKTICVGECLGD